MTQTPSGSKQAVPAFIDKLEVTSNKIRVRMSVLLLELFVSCIMRVFFRIQ